MTTPTVQDINVENLDSPLANETDAIADLGNDLLGRAQEAKASKQPFSTRAPLESRYNDALAEYAEAKYEQVERLEDRLENLIEQEMANLEDYQAHRPAGLFLRPGARGAWEREQARKQATIQRLQNRLEHVREIKEDMGLPARRLKNWRSASSA